MLNTSMIEAHLTEAMRDLENMPCGGIGSNGPGRDELDAAAKDGKVYGGDSTYHQAQSAWLWCREAMGELDERKV